MARIGGKKRRRVHRSRRKASPVLARKRRRGGFKSTRRSSRRRSGSGLSGMKFGVKEAAMIGVGAAAVSLIGMKLGGKVVGTGATAVPVLTKISAVVGGNAQYGAALMVAGLGLLAGFLLQKRAPKLARPLMYGGVVVGTVIALSEATKGITGATVTPTTPVGGISGYESPALPYPADLDGIETSLAEELAGITTDDGFGRGSVAIGGNAF